MRGLFIGVLLAALSVVLFAQAPQIRINFGNTQTLTVTTQEIAALRRMLDRVNAAQRVGETPWTLEEWLLLDIREKIDDALRVRQREATVVACERFQKLTAEEQATITAKLGGESPCVR